MQSSWYHPVLQSNPRERAASSWRTRKGYIEEAENWLAALPTSLPRAVHYLIHSETLYGILVLMLPCGNPSELDPEVRQLFIAKAVTYAQSTKELCSLKELNLSTCLDCYRCAFVGKHLVRLWSSHLAIKSKVEEENIATALAGIDYVQDCLVLRFGAFKAYRQLKPQLGEILQQARSMSYNR